MIQLRSALAAIALSFAIVSPAFAVGACQVSVVTTMKSGTVKKRVFNTKAATAADCEEDADLHTTNFFPPKIAKKEVEYRFGDAPAVKVKGDAQ